MCKSLGSWLARCSKSTEAVDSERSSHATVSQSLGSTFRWLVIPSVQSTITSLCHVQLGEDENCSCDMWETAVYVVSAWLFRPQAAPGKKIWHDTASGASHHCYRNESRTVFARLYLLGRLEPGG